MTSATYTRACGLKSHGLIHEQIDGKSLKMTMFCIQNEASLQRKFKKIDKQFVKSKYT